jgi:hypothetical protein
VIQPETLEEQKIVLFETKRISALPIIENRALSLDLSSIKSSIIDNKKLYPFPRPYYHDRRRKQKKEKELGWLVGLKSVCCC